VSEVVHADGEVDTGGVDGGLPDEGAEGVAGEGVPVLVGEEPVVGDIGMPSPACSTARARASSATAAYTNRRQSRIHSAWIVMRWAALGESRDRSVST
jgi:hypothetical protein